MKNFEGPINSINHMYQADSVFKMSDKEDMFTTIKNKHQNYSEFESLEKVNTLLSSKNKCLILDNEDKVIAKNWIS